MAKSAGKSCQFPQTSLTTAKSSQTLSRRGDNQPLSLLACEMAPRGAGYSPEEDLALAKAWASVSEDAATGTEQTGEQVYRRVAEPYNRLRPVGRERRTAESLRSRLNNLFRAILKFNGNYWSVKRKNPSNTTDDDVIRLATGLFNGMQMAGVEDDCGKPFKHLDVWRMLREHPKFPRDAIFGSKESHSVDVAVMIGDDHGSSGEDAGRRSTQTESARVSISEREKEAEKRPRGRKFSKEKD